MILRPLPLAHTTISLSPMKTATKLSWWSPLRWVLCWLYSYNSWAYTNKDLWGIVRANSVFSGVTLQRKPTSWLPTVLLLIRTDWKCVGWSWRCSAWGCLSTPHACLITNTCLPVAPEHRDFQSMTVKQHFQETSNINWMIFMDT